MMRANDLAMEELHLERKETRILREYQERERHLMILKKEVEEQEGYLEEKLRKIEEEKRSVVSSLMYRGLAGEGVESQQGLLALQLLIITENIDNNHITAQRGENREVLLQTTPDTLTLREETQGENQGGQTQYTLLSEKRGILGTFKD